MDFESAVAHLQTQETWVDGAAALARLGDRRGLLPLMRAYESRAEGGRRCLHDAMDALGGAAAARELIVSADVEERRVGAHLMQLFPDGGHIAPLAAAGSDPDEHVRRQALRALAGQRQTEAWEAAVVKLIDAADPEVRIAAAGCLEHRRTSAARQALRARVGHEQDERAEAAIRHALEENERG